MTLHIETHGNTDAANLVLIHGWGMHGGVWQPVIKSLSQHFHVHIVDLPGMGFSQPLPGLFEDNADWFDALVDSVDSVLPERASICGWSFGGQVAMQLALRYPERIQELVLAGSTPKFVNTPLDGTSLNSQTERDGFADWQYGMDAGIFRQFAANVSQDYRATLLKFLTLQCMRSSDARETIKQFRHSFEQRPAPDLHSLQLGLECLLNNDFRAHISSLAQPVLLVHGDKDTLAPVQAAYWMAEHVPNVQAMVINGASHAPFLSHAGKFIEALITFLGASTPLMNDQLLNTATSLQKAAAE